MANTTPETIYRMTRRNGDVPSLPEVTGWSKSKIYMEIAKGNFPPGVKLGPRLRGWPASSITEWQKLQGMGEATK